MGNSNSDDEYGPITGSWGDKEKLNENLNANLNSWRTLADPQTTINPSGLGSGNLHRKGPNFKPIDENYIVQQRLKGGSLPKTTNKPNRASRREKPKTTIQRHSANFTNPYSEIIAHSLDAGRQPTRSKLTKYEPQNSDKKPNQQQSDTSQPELQIQSRLVPSNDANEIPRPRKSKQNQKGTYPKTESIIQPSAHVNLQPKTTRVTEQNIPSQIPPSPLSRPPPSNGKSSWAGKPLVAVPFWQSSSQSQSLDIPSLSTVSSSAVPRFSIPDKPKFALPMDSNPRPANYRDQPPTPKTIAPPPIADNPILVTINVALDNGTKLPVQLRRHDDPDALAQAFGRDHQITSPPIISALRDLFHSQKAQAARKQRSGILMGASNSDLVIRGKNVAIYFPFHVKTLMPSSPLRSQVIALYKQLVYLGREYPVGYENFFRPKLKTAFLKKRDLTDEKDIKKAIEHGDYIVKELEMMYYLRKYRTLRKRYVEN